MSPRRTRRGFCFYRFFIVMDYSKLTGLVPAVIQDSESAEVLMVGFMNEEALALTRSTGFATFFSRTRNTLWMKGETSGNRLKVIDILVDCDDDTVLVKVLREGDGNVCHTGRRSCFFRTLTNERTTEVTE
jgi:phosphoribosyl-ATP pyrophosphohydrolase/phosphoribosyl-AMP cyclohydrolase